MALSIYKPGQGYWTRVMSAVGAGLVTLMGAYWAWEQLNTVRIGSLEPVFVQGGVTILIVAACSWFVYRTIGVKRRTVDFLIATEGEMKKVNWSTRKEVMGSTWVVIGLTFFLAIIIGILDSFVFTPFFQWINVLDT